MFRVKPSILNVTFCTQSSSSFALAFLLPLLCNQLDKKGKEEAQEEVKGFIKLERGRGRPGFEDLENFQGIQLFNISWVC